MQSYAVKMENSQYSQYSSQYAGFHMMYTLVVNELTDGNNICVGLELTRIHEFTISFPVLMLPTFRQLSVRKQISGKSLF